MLGDSDKHMEIPNYAISSPRVNVSREGIAFWRISPGLVFLNNFYLCGSGSPA